MLLNDILQLVVLLDNYTTRILRTPITTPSEIIAAETGIWDIEIQVAKKQISYYHKIRTIENPDSQLYKSAMEPKNPWRKNVERTIQELNIEIDELYYQKASYKPRNF